MSAKSKQTKMKKKKKNGEKDSFYKFKIKAGQICASLIYLIVTLYLIVAVSIILFVQELNFLFQCRVILRISLPFPVAIYLLKVKNRNTRTRCEIFSKLTIKTPKRRYWCCSGVFIVNFEYISHLVLVFLLLNLSR